MSDSQPLETLRPDALTPAQIEAKAEDVGTAKAKMPAGKSFLLACMAGIFIGLGGSFMLLVKSDASLGFAASALLGGLVFSLGLFLVVMAGAELFTGNSLMVCGRLSGRYDTRDLVRSWLVVYAGNLVGSLALVALMALANFGGMNGGAVGQTAVTVAAGKASQPWLQVFGRGILCNLLVCLAVWMSFGARTVVDKLCATTMPVIAFVAMGFEHCVANMYFLPFGMLCQGAGASIAWAGVLSNLTAATLGNLVGGVLLVGCSYWAAYAKRG